MKDIVFDDIPLVYYPLNTIEPVLSGTILSGHPVLSGLLSKSRNFFPLSTVIFISIKRSHLY